MIRPPFPQASALGITARQGAVNQRRDAIIQQDLWDRSAILAENTRTRSANTRAPTPALLKGLIFGPSGAAMSPTHTRKGNRLYRYYVSQDVLKRDRMPARSGGCRRPRSRQQ
jgi:hypothetical protein